MLSYKPDRTELADKILSQLIRKYVGTYNDIHNLMKANFSSLINVKSHYHSDVLLIFTEFSLMFTFHLPLKIKVY